MADLLIVVALVVANALAHSAYVRWRGLRRPRAVRRFAMPVGVVYPTHPSPGVASVPDHAIAVGLNGIDW